MSKQASQSTEHSFEIVQLNDKFWVRNTRTNWATTRGYSREVAEEILRAVLA